MPYRKILFEKGQPAHIISRAVIDVFRKPEDCYRFIYQFYASNHGKRGFNVHPADAIKAGRALLHGEKISAKFVIKEHPPFVHLIDFSLVINHCHFYLVPNSENAVPIFMQRFKNGFAKYFNSAHNRENVVFGAPYKGIKVTTDRQSSATSRYVGIINPLDVFQPGWRENGLIDPKKALIFLENFEFSSFPDRIGKRNAEILAPKEILEQYSWGTVSGRERDDFKQFVEEFLKEKSNPSQRLFLE